jgi:hypothetical protein
MVSRSMLYKKRRTPEVKTKFKLPSLKALKHNKAAVKNENK